MLEMIYREALASYKTDDSMSNSSRAEENYLSIVIENQEKRKAVVAVLVTLLLKKILSPDQDIRLHRAEFDGGFSGRRLDTTAVTPFLRAKQFPSMSESGCQLIVNGVDRTLLYYLRLIGDTRSFIDEYVSHLENDDAITFEVKDTWNKIVANV